MAHHTLAVLSSPDFPQVLAAAIDRAFERVLAHPQFGNCDYTDEYVDCMADATVHHLASGHEFCARHFTEVSRGN